jgi:hypothetical protein
MSIGYLIALRLVCLWYLLWAARSLKSSTWREKGVCSLFSAIGLATHPTLATLVFKRAEIRFLEKIGFLRA